MLVPAQSTHVALCFTQQYNQQGTETRALIHTVSSHHFLTIALQAAGNDRTHAVLLEITLWGLLILIRPCSDLEELKHCRTLSPASTGTAYAAATFPFNFLYSDGAIGLHGRGASPGAGIQSLTVIGQQQQLWQDGSLKCQDVPGPALY